MIAKLKVFISDYYVFLLLYLVFGVSLGLRIVNINYNSPFNDEATFMLVGKMGVFQRDWWSYNTSAWLAGSPYVYPVMSALAGTLGGITGSRLLNVVFGVLTVEVIFAITMQISRDRYPQNIMAGIIAAVIVGGSVTGLYISRLATYDAPSYYFLLCSLYFLIKAIKTETVNGKNYFFSAFFLLLASLTKIIVLIYLPLYIAFSYYQARVRGGKFLFFWKRYFFIPLLISLGIYVISNLNGLKSYALVSASKEKSSFLEIGETIWTNIKFLVLPLLFSVGILIWRRRHLLVFSLVVAALWIIVPHLFSQRALVTMEKGLFLVFAFSAPLIGIALSSLIYSFRDYRYLLSSVLVAISLLLYLDLSYSDSLRFNDAWDNSDQAVHYLAQNINNGDKVLVESGGTAILGSYDRDEPNNFTTFDWFVYNGQSGPNAYKNAVKDGYFKYIELEGKGQQGGTIFSSLHNLVAQSAQGSYESVYSQKGFEVYRRVF